MSYCGRYLLIAYFAAVVSGLAQNTGSINGTVMDSSQAVIPDAQIVLTNTGTGESREVRSSKEGYFTIVDLLPGSYTLHATAGGFKTLVQGPIVLTVGQQLSVHVALQVGVVSENVQVVGTPPPVSTYSSSVSQLVDSQRIAELPLNGRNALSLVGLAPGVVSAGTGGQFGAQQVTFNVSGGRNINVNFQLDGGQNMNSFYNVPNSYPNPDTLQEFAVSTRQYSAAFGRGTASVAAVSKSGTNEIHGSAFEFLRNTELDSRSFFANSRSVFKRNQYGATVGGPIVRNKLFFLVGYQGTKARGTPGESNIRTFTAAERTGDFSGWSTALKDPDNGNVPIPGNIIPASRIRPFAKNFISKYMAPANSGPDYYRFTLANNLDQNQLTTRVDYSANDNNKFWFRYLLDDVPQIGSNGGNSIDSNFVSNFPARFQNYNAGYTRVFSPTLINDMRLTYGRSSFGVINSLKFSLADLGLPVDLTNSPTDHGLTPQSVMAVTGHFTINIGAPTRDIMPTTHFADTLTWMRGKHQLSFGAEVYHNRVNEIQNWLTGGNISFNGAASGIAAADLLLGKFNSYRQISGFASRLRQTLPAFFVQDDFRVSSRVTVNLGIRWDPSRPYVSEDNLLMAFVPGVKSQTFPNAPAGLLYPGDAGLPSSIASSRWNNIAPRAGFAWDVRGNGRTSVRAGFGLFVVPTTRGITYNRFPLIQPYTADVTVSGGDIGNIFAAAPYNGKSPYPVPNVSDKQTLLKTPFLPAANETSLALPFKSEVERQWSLSIQQAVGKDAVVEAAYVGSSASHLTTSVEANPAVYIPGQSTLANLQQRRLYPSIGSVNTIADILSSNYNGLQLSFNKRYAHGLAIQSGYTWSKGLGVDNAQGEGSNGPRNPNNYRLDYGPLGSDRRHNLTASVIWNVPGGDNLQTPWLRQVAGGWQLSTIVSAVSGAPLTMRSGRDNSLLGVANDTADQVGDWRMSGDRSKADQIMKWFNPAAFAQNPTGTFGTSGIGIVTGPGSYNFDIGLTKAFRIGERRGLQFRSSFFNALNHANLNNPNTTATAAAFGRIAGASTPRVIELGLRLHF